MTRIVARLSSMHLARRRAALLAAMFVVGLAGGVAVGAARPFESPYQLIALSYLDPMTPADVAPPAAILRLGGELRVLTIENQYRADRLARTTVQAIFADLAGVAEWAAAYPDADAGTARVLRLTLVGPMTRTIDITNPDANRTVPRDLLSVVTDLQRLSIDVARSGAPVDDHRLRARAVPVESFPPSVPIEALPEGVTISDLAKPGGVVVDRSGSLAAAWHAYEFLAVMNTRYVTDADGQVWRLSWSVDLEDLKGRP